MATTVLIVDDVPFVRKTLTDIFTAANFQVVGEAADGFDAIKQYARLRPNIVTMDIVMPDLSGIEATRRILAMDKEACIVIISAMAQENLVMEAINVGARDFILKPFNAGDVIRTVQHAYFEEGSRHARLAAAKEHKSR
jgi:two-component system chemotaxis response regulator CheY